MNDIGTTLATVIDVSECQSAILADWIQQRIKHCKEIDDVFQVQFLQGVLFSGGPDNCSLSSGAQALLEGLGMQWHRFSNNGSGTQPLPGPYVILDGALHEPSRFYADTHAAFFLVSGFTCVLCYLLKRITEHCETLTHKETTMATSILPFHQDLGLAPRPGFQCRDFVSA